MPEVFRGERVSLRWRRENYSNTGDKRFFKNTSGRADFGRDRREKIPKPHGHPLWDGGVYPEEATDTCRDRRRRKWAAEKLSQPGDEAVLHGRRFLSTHVPDVAPQEMVDLLPRNEINLPLVREDDRNEFRSVCDRPNPNCVHVSPTHEWITGRAKWEHGGCRRT